MFTIIPSIVWVLWALLHDAAVYRPRFGTLALMLFGLAFSIEQNWEGILGSSYGSYEWCIGENCSTIYRSIILPCNWQLLIWFAKYAVSLVRHPERGVILSMCKQSLKLHKQAAAKSSSLQPDQRSSLSLVSVDIDNDASSIPPLDVEQSINGDTITSNTNVLSDHRDESSRIFVKPSPNDDDDIELSEINDYDVFNHDSPRRSSLPHMV